jgi:hypothetical protein
MCDGNKLFGLPLQLRFLDLFDTVASMNFSNELGGDAYHEWAPVEDLKIDARVQNWRHL